MTNKSIERVTKLDWKYEAGTGSNGYYIGIRLTQDEMEFLKLKEKDFIKVNIEKVEE